MKKIFLFGGGSILFYMVLVYIIPKHNIIFPVFMTSIFFLSFYISKIECLTACIPITGIWIIQFFIPDTITSINVIYTIFTPLTFWVGFYLKNKGWFHKISYLTLLLFIGYFGFDNLWAYTSNIHSKQKITTPRIVFYDKNNTQIQLDTITNKIIILNFWATSCGVCFKDFPAFDKIYLKYNNNSRIMMYGVNIPTKKDSMGQAKNKIESYNYSFPKLYAQSDSISRAIGINKYPYILILKDSEIRFIGDFIYENNIYFYRLEDEIELLLNEE